MKQLRVLLFSILALVGSSAFAQASLDWTMPDGYPEIEPDTLHYNYYMQYADLPASSREFVDASFQLKYLLNLRIMEPEKNSTGHRQWQQAWNFLTGEFRKMHEGKPFYLCGYSNRPSTDIYTASGITLPVEDTNVSTVLEEMPSLQLYQSAGDFIGAAASAKISEDDAGPEGGRMINIDTLQCTPNQNYADLNGYCKEYMNDAFETEFFNHLWDAQPDSTKTADLQKFLRVKNFMYTQFKNMYEGKPFYFVTHDDKAYGATNVIVASGLTLPPDSEFDKFPGPWEGVLLDTTSKVVRYQTAGQCLYLLQASTRADLERNERENEIIMQREGEANLRAAAEAERRRAAEAAQRRAQQQRAQQQRQQQSEGEIWAPAGIFGNQQQSNSFYERARRMSTSGSEGGSMSTGSSSSSGAKSYTVVISLTFRDGTTAVKNVSSSGSSAQEAAERALQLFPISQTDTPKAIVNKSVQDIRGPY